jgi:rsbT co-antagonist protein RsbR
MTPAPSFEDIYQVMAQASVGNSGARVPVPEEPDVNDTATRFGLALNVLLADLEARAAAQKAQQETIEAQLETNQRQQDAILALSMPVLLVEQDVLLLPVVGALDAARVGRLLDSALEAVHTTGARVVLIDLTGVLTIDAVAAAGLVKAVRAVALLGATTLLCGISARVAAAMKTIGPEVRTLRMVSNLRTGIAEARLPATRAPLLPP